ncbi:MAG: hypothetical protein QNJ85_11455 [Gammaproteobacteria bacterium]|nr:hypothetical protein [Gammaproteobacteria bacterium]
MRSEFVAADGQQAQVEALKTWVREHSQQKAPCVCLVAGDDCDVYQVEKPQVEDAEMLQAVTWKIKDLISYDVANAVVDCYPMPVSSKNNQQQVGVVSARESVIASYVDSIRSCGLKLVALDIHDLVRSNLQIIRHAAEQTLAVLSLTRTSGLLSVYHDTDLYVSREFMIGLDQLELAGGEDTEVFDSLLLEIQRSLDYFESYYGIGAVNSLRVFPQLPATEKMAMYLQNLASFDIDFIVFGADADNDGLEPHCFHAYCAAMRGVHT